VSEASTSSWLRQRVTAGPLLVLPGAANALTARIIEDTGFEAVYVTGAGTANTFLGAPDIGLVSLSELSAHVAAIRQSVQLPLLVDADTGFGNAIGLGRCVRELERAGADAIQLEDQLSPKKCGHFAGKQLIATSDMVQKLHAALDARRDEDVLLIANARCALRVTGSRVRGFACSAPLSNEGQAVDNAQRATRHSRQY
jgi:2-methylisocitrate lyase-like PEP mutase family enzyme